MPTFTQPYTSISVVQRPNFVIANVRLAAIRSLNRKLEHRRLMSFRAAYQTFIGVVEVHPVISERLGITKVGHTRDHATLGNQKTLIRPYGLISIMRSPS
jgi:hypothetical protein